MALVTFEIGVAPHLADCAQLGHTRDYDRINRLETEVYRAALIARFGPPPEAARLFIGDTRHDFGVYREVKISYDPSNPEATGYATEVGDGLAHWSDGCFTPPVAYARDESIVLTARGGVDHAIGLCCKDRHGSRAGWSWAGSYAV